MSIWFIVIWFQCIRLYVQCWRIVKWMMEWLCQMYCNPILMIQSFMPFVKVPTEGEKERRRMERKKKFGKWYWIISSVSNHFVAWPTQCAIENNFCRNISIPKSLWSCRRYDKDIIYWDNEIYLQWTINKNL